MKAPHNVIRLGTETVTCVELFLQVMNLTPNQAAAQAIQLFSQEARLCLGQPMKVARTQSDVTMDEDERCSGTGDGNRRDVAGTCGSLDRCQGEAHNAKSNNILPTLSTQGELSLGGLVYY